MIARAIEIAGREKHPGRSRRSLGFLQVAGRSGSPGHKRSPSRLIAAINPGLLKASGRSNSSFQSGTACTRTPVSSITVKAISAISPAIR